jgi:hypothetical protein
MTKKELKAVVLGARARQAEAERFYKEEQQRQEEQARLMLEYRAKLLPQLRKASPRDYALWLAGHLSRGGQISHVYPYKLSGRFFVLVDDLEIEMPLYGSSSLSLIVPADLKLTTPADGLGHCNAFWMEDFTHLGACVPLYSDIDF